MYEQGYDPTSYTEIAERACVGRSLVQRHFPRKELFILDLIEDASDASRRLLAQASDAREGTLPHTVRLTQLYFSLLLHDDQMIRLTGEVVADRRFSVRIIDQHHRSAFCIFQDADELTARDACFRAMGAAYEIIEERICSGGTLDADELACQTVALFAALATGTSYGEARRSLRQQLLPESVAQALADRLMAALLEV